ncbi:hypothetical protein Syun_016954 [Stephania yunnanensis]|uniref:Uncharacterized protein n=1 Tax=Stephania yunnanensis TaxID=152371 RepID=A0AAP0J5Q1_9MAGN
MESVVDCTAAAAARLSSSLLRASLQTSNDRRDTDHEGCGRLSFLAPDGEMEVGERN